MGAMRPGHLGAILSGATTRLLVAVLLLTLIGVRTVAHAQPASGNIHAGMFPDPAKDLPQGWWWAKDQGAVYQPPKKWTESVTPIWVQTIELSRASGYVFKPYPSTPGGVWCRPERNGKCDLPFMRVTIEIMDAGAKQCMSAQNLAFSQETRWQKTRLSERSFYFTRNDPPQYWLESCVGRYRTVANVVGYDGEPPNLDVARHFDAVVARRIGGAIGPQSQSTDQGVPGGDPSTPVTPSDTAATDGGEVNAGANELTDAEIATAAGIAGGAALLGSLLMLGATGVRREEASQAIRDLLRGQRAGGPVRGVEAQVRGAGLEVQREERRGDLRSGGRCPQRGRRDLFGGARRLRAAGERDAARPAAAAARRRRQRARRGVEFVLRRLCRAQDL